MTKLRNPVTNMVTRGAKTLHRVDVSRTPNTPEGEPPAELLPGKVKARTTGKADCIAKYIGNVFVCKAENWGRGKTLNCMNALIKD